MSGIVPKMAIRFTSYEWYKQLLADKDGIVSSRATFLGTFLQIRCCGGSSTLSQRNHTNLLPFKLVSAQVSLKLLPS